MAVGQLLIEEGKRTSILHFTPIEEESREQRKRVPFVSDKVSTEHPHHRKSPATQISAREKW